MAEQLAPDLYFEDFEPGRSFPLGLRTVTADEIVAFATDYDPQPMHLDEAAGRASILGGLAASGWHMVSLLMAMMCDAYVLRSASEGGPGIDTVAWKRPLIAGDTLSGESTVTARRRSASRPAVGIVTMRHELRNQRGETVLTCDHPVMIGLRQPEIAA